MLSLTKHRSLFLLLTLALLIIVACVSSFTTWSLTKDSGAGASLLGLRSCSANSLTAFEQHQGAGGSMYVNVIFINQSKRDCTLEGYPVVSLFSADGMVMAHEPQRNSSWVRTRRVVLKSGGVDGFVLQYGEEPVPGVDPSRGCRVSTEMKVELPHAIQFGYPYTAYFTMPLAPCDGGGFEVTAIQHGDPNP